MWERDDLYCIENGMDPFLLSRPLEEKNIFDKRVVNWRTCCRLLALLARTCCRLLALPCCRLLALLVRKHHSIHSIWLPQRGFDETWRINILTGEPSAEKVALQCWSTIDIGWKGVQYWLKGLNQWCNSHGWALRNQKFKSRLCFSQLVLQFTYFTVNFTGFTWKRKTQRRSSAHRA